MRILLKIILAIVGLWLFGAFLCGVFYRSWIEKHIHDGIQAELVEHSLEEVSINVDLLHVSLARTGASGDLREAHAAAAKFSGAIIEGGDYFGDHSSEPTLQLSRDSREGILSITGRLGNEELKQELLRQCKASAGAQKIVNHLNVYEDANNPWWLTEIGPFVTDVLGLTNRVNFELSGEGLLLKAEAMDNKSKQVLLSSANRFLEGRELELEFDVVLAPREALLSLRRDGDFVVFEGLLPNEKLKSNIIEAIETSGELTLLDHCKVEADVETPWWIDLSYKLSRDFLASVGGRAQMRFRRNEVAFSGRLPNQAYQIQIQSIVDEAKSNFVDAHYDFTFADPAQLFLGMVNGRLVVDGKVSSIEERREILRLLTMNFSTIEIENRLDVSEDTAVAIWLSSLPPLFDRIDEVDELQLKITGKTIELSGEVGSKKMMKELFDYLKFVASDHLKPVNELIVPPKAARRHAEKQAFLKALKDKKKVKN